MEDAMTRIVDRDLELLRERALRMGSLAEAILAKALRAVWERQASLCDEVVQDDLAIDRVDLEIDEAVLTILALRSPVALDLRQVIAAKTLATDLERVGDLARNIAGSARRLIERSVVPLPPRLEKLADDSRRLLRKALDSFATLDAAAARRVLEGDDEIDHGEEVVVREAIEEISHDPEICSQEVEFILIAKNLERVADHATNIAEEVVHVSEARNLKHAQKLQG
jgi:phosphate transport system protein